jgi:hypothetical protein
MANTTVTPSEFDWTWLTLTYQGYILLMGIGIASVIFIGGLIAYSMRWIHFFRGARGDKCVYVSWWHGDGVIDTLRSEDYAAQANRIIANLQDEDKLPSNASYCIDDSNSPLKLYRCLLHPCLGSPRTVRAHREVFKRMRGYPDFDHAIVIDNQINTVISMYRHVVFSPITHTH